MTEADSGGRDRKAAPAARAGQDPRHANLADAPAWVRDAVFYQIFPDRFSRSGRVEAPGALEPWETRPTRHGFKGGDLYGIVDRLDDLAELGITALYLNPIFASASNHRYHTYDYFRVDPLLGGDEALHGLLEAAHSRNLRVILDGVFNHASRGFWPFQHVAENGADSPYRSWFYLDPAVLRGERGLQPYPDDGALTRAIESAEPWERQSGAVSQRILGYRAWWDLPALPKLNTSDPEMREYLMRVAEHWLRFGIDGWRLDVPMEIADDEFWREFRRRVRTINPEAYIVAEIWREEPRYLQGDMFDALMAYPFTEAVIGFTAGSHLDLSVAAEQFEYEQFIRPLDGPAFAARLERVLTTYRPDVTAVQLNLLGSHDTPRFLTVAGGDRDALRLATLIQMTVPGAPCLYYGDEVGVGGHHDPDNRRSYPMDRARWDADLRQFIAGAIALRRVHPVLRDRGSFAVLGARGMAYAHGRFSEDERYVVAINAGDTPEHLRCVAKELRDARLVAVPLPGVDDAIAGGSPAEVVVDAAGGFELLVPARRGIVFEAIG